MFFKKKKKIGFPKDIFKFPLKHRFTFVAEGCSHFSGFSFELSDKLSKKKAFYYAAELFLEKEPGAIKKPVAVYYGEVEAPDCNDCLYGAYNLFNKGRRK